MTTKAAQTFLISQGYDLGPWGADGVAGRMTQAATRAWQERVNIKVTGVLDNVTLKTMGIDEINGPPPWFDLMLKKKGLHEGRDYKELSQWLKSDGKTLGDPRKNPWCGDGMETCIALTLPNEILPGNPYLARNWSKFGRAVAPSVGAIMTFWRGSKSGTFGHVAQYVGEDKTTYTVLGANQSNSISVTTIAKSRLLAIRWPLTYPLPKAGAVQMAGGTLSNNEA